MAIYLYNLGFNVFPQPIAQKAGLPWKQLQYTRLSPDHPEVGIQALTAGQCNLAILCGSTSRNLFVIDCESPSALNHHIGHLRERGIPLWVVETARGGHIYLHCADGEVANIESGILVDAEIRGSRGYVLAPSSVHPSGTVYRWLHRDDKTPPTVNAKTIDWLTDTNGRSTKLKLTTTKRRKTSAYNPLSHATQDYLSSGHTLPEGSRNNHLFKAACDLLGNGYSIHEIEHRLAPIAEVSGLPREEIHTTLRSAASRERGPSRPHKSPIRRIQTELWQHARTFAETHQWQGRTTTSDKLVFLALTERARTANENGIFRASLREISELARTSINPIRNALERLKKTQLIFYMGTDKTSTASLWKFSKSLLQEGKLRGDTFPAPPPWESWSVSQFSSTDAAERGALGYNGLSVYQTLIKIGQPLMPSALAATMGISVNQVNYALKKLRDYHLVQREKSGWRAFAVSNAELDERVARPAGKLGRGARRRERYASERAIYVGRIILQARLEMFQEDFLNQPRELLLDHSDFADTLAPLLQTWRCPNCGQHHFGDLLPEMCAYCDDFTTWQPLISEADRETLADPLIQDAIALGAEIYDVDAQGKRRRIYPLLE